MKPDNYPIVTPARPEGSPLGGKAGVQNRHPEYLDHFLDAGFRRHDGMDTETLLHNKSEEHVS